MSRLPEAGRERQGTITNLSIAMLQKGLTALGLPSSHISPNHIHLVNYSDYENIKQRFSRYEGEAGVFYAPKDIYILTTDQQGKPFSTGVIFSTELHEEGHFVGFEFIHHNTFQLEKKKKTEQIERHGYSVVIGKNRYFRGLDEASAEHFAEFLLATGKNLLAGHDNLTATRVGVADPSLSDDYKKFYLFWDTLAQGLAQHANMPLEEAQKKLLSGMASPDASFLFDLEKYYGPQALLLLGLYGLTPNHSTIVGGGTEPLAITEERQGLIRAYFLPDNQIRQDRYVLNTFGSIPHQIPPAEIRAALAQEVRNSAVKWNYTLQEEIDNLPIIAKAVFSPNPPDVIQLPSIVTKRRSQTMLKTADTKYA